MMDSPRGLKRKLSVSDLLCCDEQVLAPSTPDACEPKRWCAAGSSQLAITEEVVACKCLDLGVLWTEVKFGWELLHRVRGGVPGVAVPLLFVVCLHLAMKLIGTHEPRFVPGMLQELGLDVCTSEHAYDAEVRCCEAVHWDMGALRFTERHEGLAAVTKQAALPLAKLFARSMARAATESS